MDSWTRQLYLAGALVLAVSLWMLSRTERGGAVLAAGVDAVSNALKPRGIRNNNPGNIDWIAQASKRWRGMIRKETPEEGGRFAVFDTPANGVRAIAKELGLDARRGIRTVAVLIGGDPRIPGSGWAPSSENDTPAYVRAVASELRVEPGEAIDVHEYLPRLVAAIVRHENGRQPYSDAQLREWVYMA